MQSQPTDSGRSAEPRVGELVAQLRHELEAHGPMATADLALYATLNQYAEERDGESPFWRARLALADLARSAEAGELTGSLARLLAEATPFTVAGGAPTADDARVVEESYARVGAALDAALAAA